MVLKYSSIPADVSRRRAVSRPVDRAAPQRQPGSTLLRWHNEFRLESIPTAKAATAAAEDGGRTAVQCAMMR